MKKVFLSFAFVLVALFSHAQNSIQYTLKWNPSQSRYEVYAKPNFSQASFSWGSSQVGIVTPASAPNSITVTSGAVSGWSVGQTIVLAPSVQPQNDFFGVSTTGSSVSLSANTEIMLFSFIFQGGTCADGIRLFVTNSDPNSAGAGMNGGDFRNYVYDDSGLQFYTSNYNNTGTQCNPCSITAPELSKN